MATAKRKQAKPALSREDRELLAQMEAEAKDDICPQLAFFVNGSDMEFIELTLNEYRTLKLHLDKIRTEHPPAECLARQKKRKAEMDRMVAAVHAESESEDDDEDDYEARSPAEKLEGLRELRALVEGGIADLEREVASATAAG